MGFKNLVPKLIKRPIKKAVLRGQLNRSIRKIASLQEHEIPGRDLLSDLMIGWDNEGYVANLDYLDEVARRASETRGNILECGSGATTLLLGILAARRPTQVWSLEHSEEWKERVANVLETNRISAARVCFSPLIDYGEFNWYDPPLTQMPKQISLVICDGPPGTTKGGRYGLLPVMLDRLTEQCLILLDDASRPGEIELIGRWEKEFGFQATIIDHSNHSFAVIRRP